jgi:3-hydroxyisobutyrate dehydrogenase-like beta-hydroxyacid dehydrogenase
MARHLLEGGHEVHGVDTDPGARARAGAAGVHVHESTARMASETDATLVVVGFDDEVRASCSGDGGVLEGAAPGHVLFVCSTVRPSVSVEVGESAASQGVEVMDATLCRSEHAAVSGELLVLLGGSEAVFEPWRAAFETFASDIVHMGPLGTGQVAKTLNNALLWAAVVANAEVLRLGMRLGIEQETLRKALLLSSGANWALETWQRTRPMPWAEKDMEIALELAAQAGLPVPLTADVATLIGAVKQEKADTPSHGDLGGSSMEAFLEAIEDQGRPD